MARYFVVQSFVRGKRGNFAADLPMQCTSEGHAERLALRLSESKAAVVAFYREGDPVTGEYDEAVIIAQHGELPAYADDIAIAS